MEKMMILSLVSVWLWTERRS